jgi:hypothetical protein
VAQPDDSPFTKKLARPHRHARAFTVSLNFHLIRAISTRKKKPQKPYFTSKRERAQRCALNIMARRQITTTIDPTELPDLTPQQAEFVRHVVSGKTATDAYKAAYDCGGSLPRTIWAEASRLRNDPDIAAWIDAAKIAGLGSTAVTYERHINELERLKALCIKSGNMGAAVQCEQTIGKAAGLHVDKIMDVTPADPVQTLKDIAQHQPDLAAALAAQAGIEWTADEGATKH